MPLLPPRKLHGLRPPIHRRLSDSWTSFEPRGLITDDEFTAKRQAIIDRL
jgi:hypothetical protein